MSRDEENIDEPDLNDGAGLQPADSNPEDQLKPAQPQPKQAGATGSTDADDMLFEAPEAPEEVSEEFGTRQQFAEGSPTRWGGHAMSADEIGIPIESQPGYLSSDDDFGLDSEQELELVDDESQLDVDAAEPEQLDADSDDPTLVAADEDLVLDDEPIDDTIYTEAAEDVLALDGQDQTDGEFFVLDEAEQSGSLLRSEPLPADSYPVEEGWEPVGQEGEGGDSWLEPQPTAAPIGGETESFDFAPGLAGSSADELEEQYYEEAAPAVVAAAPRRAGRVLRMLTSVAAAVVVVGAGAVVVLRPEWLGLHFEPQLVERVQVARPNVDNRIAPPPSPVVRTAPPVVPTPPEVVRVDPHKLPDPIDVLPLPTDPVAVVEPPLPSPEPDQPQETPVGTRPANDVPRYLPVGDQLWIGEFDNRERRTAEWAQVQLGAKAFAQLHNGNYFIGSVKAVNSDALILAVKSGEVTLPRDEVEKVATLDSQEYAELQQATTGFLRLSNRNRLVGTILKSVVDDNYVLQIRSDRVVVPRTEVEQVVSQPGVDNNLRFSSANDEEEWLRGIAAKQLQAMSTGMPATPAGEGRKKLPATQPLLPPRANKPAPLPVKEVGRKKPVDRYDGK